jgi:phosphate transport system substrate-binding protein
MRSVLRAATIAAVACAVAACGSSGAAGSRDYVRSVGSSTVYPFATAVAEQVAKTGFKSPVVEATGTGAGLKLFCAGLGYAHPDIANASRRIKKSELEQCRRNGVTRIVEIQVGLDGIAFAGSVEGPGMALTPADVYKAIAANPFGRPNRYASWRQVNPKLPDMPITVYGPPATSGTRDALAELILTAGCRTDPATAALEKRDPDRFKAVCTQVREDGGYVDAGENDNLVVQKISENPRAIGVFGFSFLEENPRSLRGIAMSGVMPSYRSIADFSYPGARPLFIYVKAAHLKPIKGLAAYVQAWSKLWGPGGVLQKKGMVIAPEPVRRHSAAIVAAMTPLGPAGLK